MLREVSIDEIVKTLGGQAAVGRLLGINRASVAGWIDRIPPKSANLLQLYCYYNQITYKGREIDMEILMPEIYEEAEALKLIPAAE